MSGGACGRGGCADGRAASITAATTTDSSATVRFIVSACQRIGPHLELHQLALGPLAAFDVPHEVRAVVGVERAALPAAVGVVDAAVEPAGVEAERIRNAQRHPAPRL